MGGWMDGWDGWMDGCAKLCSDFNGDESENQVHQSAVRKKKSQSYLALVAETKLAKELKLLVEALLLKRATRGRVGLGALDGSPRHCGPSL